MKRTALLFTLLAAAFTAAGAQKPTYKRDVPPALARQAKVKESAAAATARRLVPGASIAALELEHEGGRLIYSFDMKTAGKDGIDEANVDAMTGRPVGKVQHESGADEARESAAEKKATHKKGGGGGRS
jgi:Peptidase propeptide and YPEB domain